MKKSKRSWAAPDTLADIVAGVTAAAVLVLSVVTATNITQVPWFHENISSITLGLLSIFVVVAILEKRIFSKRLREELVEELKKVQIDSLQQRVKASGISNLYLSRADYLEYRGAATLADYLGTSKTTIRIAAHWLSQGIEMEGIADSLAKFVKEGRTVEIAVVDPDSSSIKQVSDFFGISENDAVNRINGTLTDLHRAKMSLPRNKLRRFRILTYDTLATASVIMLDDDVIGGRIQVDFKVFQTPRHQSFGFELSGSETPSYQLWRRAYRELIDQGTEHPENAA